MQIIQAERKLTNRYNAGWSDLDETQPMGFTLKTVRGATKYDDNYERSTTYLHVTASRPISYRELRATLHHFSRGCRCEHDCCSHWNGGAGVPVQVSKNGRKWAIPLHYSMNI
jgi:hypothetical protein